MNQPQIPAAKPLIGEEERAAVDRVLRSGMLAQGPEVAAFEQEFSEALLGGRTCVAVNSGTSGLHLGLLAAGIGPGDEVIVPSFTFAATGNSVALTGATPVFADIELDTFGLDPDSVAAAVTERTAAIMPVHLYGHPADMAGLQAVADSHRLRIFEDAAQAHGATLHEDPVGTFGDFAMFSLYPTKNMTSGEGGMVAVATEEMTRTLRLLRTQGMDRPYENELVGFNARMTDVHAAIGRAQLAKLAGWTATRQANAATLTAGLSGVPGVVTPTVSPGATHVFHQYTIRLEDASAEERDAVAGQLRDQGVGCGVYYPIPNHRLPSLAHYAPEVHLPVTEQAAREVLSLPVHPSLSGADLDRIIDAVTAAVGSGR